MATRTRKARKQIPPDLRQAIEDGELTREQLEQLIEIEASHLGLSFDEAVERAQSDTLPKNFIGIDIRLLVRMLVA